MKNEPRPVEICPICGKEYRAVPALSRLDNKTPICPECGIRQALDSIGVQRPEQDDILRMICDYGGAM